MTVPNRSYSSPSYRYGFQGQEKDDEIKGNGNSLNYKYRMHDPRIGRFFATDPLEAKYPFYTPYQFSGNRVIDMIELEGLEPTETGDKEGQKEFAQDQKSSNNPKTLNGKSSKYWIWHQGGVKQDIGATTSAGWYTEDAYANLIKPMAITFAMAIKSQNNRVPTPEPTLPLPNEFLNSREFVSGYGSFLFKYGSDVINAEAMEEHFQKTGQINTDDLNSPILLFSGAFAKITKIGAVSKVPTGLTLGSDAVTLRNAERLVPEDGIFQLLVHGEYDNFIINGVRTSTDEVAEEILKIGFKPGTPIRCISCNTGKFLDGAAFKLSKKLKSPVLAPTNKVRVLENGGFEIFENGAWKQF